MISNHINKSMIQSAINKGIKDIEDNPKRGLRNLVDLAKHFSNSPFQKYLFNLMQSQLNNVDSPYYNIIDSIVNNVNHKTLNNFGVNLGYNSWTLGTKTIREHKEDYCHHIPWTIVFDFTTEEDQILNKKSIMNIIEQGKKLGIYTYIFFANNIEDYLDILNTNPNCAFILFLPLKKINTDSISKIASYNNVFLSIPYEASMNMVAFQNTISLVKENKSLFGIYSSYSDNNIEEILSDKWVNAILDKESAFAFLVESKDCSSENSKLIEEYVIDSRTNQTYPVFLIDLYKDILYIDKIISGDKSMPEIMEKGAANYYKYNECNIPIKKKI